MCPDAVLAVAADCGEAAGPSAVRSQPCAVLLQAWSLPTARQAPVPPHAPTGNSNAGPPPPLLAMPCATLCCPLQGSVLKTSCYIECCRVPGRLAGDALRVVLHCRANPHAFAYQTDASKAGIRRTLSAMPSASTPMPRLRYISVRLLRVRA